MAQDPALPSAVDGFDPNVDGNVYATALQTDGSLIVAGQFGVLQQSIGNRAGRNNIARLLPNGIVDGSFDPNANGAIRAVVMQADGKILVVGDFTAFQPNGAPAAGAVTRKGIARLNTDGSIDPTFSPPDFTNSIQFPGQTSATSVPTQIYALLLQPDGSIVVGGNFTNVGNATRNHIARLDSKGVLDSTFDPNADNIVYALAQHTSKRIIVGGAFSKFQANKATTATTRNRIARLNPDGTVDNNIDTSVTLANVNPFDPNADNRVLALAVQRDGKILAGGDFLNVQPFGTASPVSRAHLVRLNTDGSLDTSYNANTSASVVALAVAPDGRLLVGGSFVTVWANGGSLGSRRYVARFNIDGGLDLTFDAGVNNQVDAFAFQADGQIVLGGHFTGAVPLGSATSLARNHLARINPAGGALDATLNLDASGRVLASAMLSDGSILIGGSFTSIGGVLHNHMARLSSNGTVDPNFHPNFNERVLAIVPQASGKILVGGMFTTTANDATTTPTTRNYIARLNSDGSLDTGFNPNANGAVSAIVVQSDLKKILISGQFTTLQPPEPDPTKPIYSVAIPRNYIARLNDDTLGTLDDAFDPNANNFVPALALQSDGKILIGGNFTTLNPNNSYTTDATTHLRTYTSDHTTSRNRLARLNTDGTVDGSFTVSLDDQVSRIVVQSDNNILISGNFSSIFPNGANTTTKRLHIARIKPDGTLDTVFDPSANGAVLALAVQSNGQIVIGGAFTLLTPNGATGATLRKYIARLNKADGSVDPAFDLDVNDQVGNRVDSITVQPTDGNLLIGGTFTSLQPKGVPNRVAVNHFARIIAATGALDTFQPGIGGYAGGTVAALAVQSDGKIVAAGKFVDIGGTTTTNIARFDPAGVPDTSFAPALAADDQVNALLLRPAVPPAVLQGKGIAWLNADGTLLTAFNPYSNPSADSRITGTVAAVVRQADGKIIVGGAFTTPGGAYGSNLVRIFPSGAIDSTFSPSPDGAVTAIVIENDGTTNNGTILVSGSFANIGGAAQANVARLNQADGSLDTAKPFNPAPNARVDAILMQPDNKIVIGGAFTTVSPVTTATTNATATTRNYIARLNADGTVDTAFDPNMSGAVTALALQSTDNAILIAGNFTSLTPAGSSAATTRNHLARVTTAGAVDAVFDPNLNDVVSALAFNKADGSVLAGGAFTTAQPNGSTPAVPRNHLARFKSDGTLDATFDPKPNGNVASLTIVQDNTVNSGKILVGGAFTTFQPTNAPVPTTRNHIARLNSDGTVDAGFNPDADDSINVFAALADGTIVAGGAFTSLQPNGTLLVGGAFKTIGNAPQPYLALVTDDGSISPSFNPVLDGAVNALVAQSDGKTVVAGAFTKIGGAPHNGVARFNAAPALTLDTGFKDPAVNGPVRALALQADGIVIGGAFTTVSGQARNGLARLKADGSLDATFTSTAFSMVTGISVQSDGRLLVLGTAGSATGRLLRLNSDGSTDATFSAAWGNSINAVALQADGKILVGGSWVSVVVASVPAPFAASYLARFNANGSYDPTFNPSPDGVVSTLAIQPDGRVLLAGSFGSVGGLVRGSLARLSVSTPATQILAASPTALVWTRNGGGPELAGVTFEVSADEQIWSAPVGATRVNGTASWQLTGLSAKQSSPLVLPATGLFYIRARGFVPSSSGTSVSTVETVREFNFAQPSGVGPAGTSGTVTASGFTVDLATGLLTGAPSIVGATSSGLAKISGAATEVLSNVYLPSNGNTYDQVLLTGASATITADPGQVTRLSYLDLSGDIVQVEFSGAGALSIVLDNPSGPMPAANYNQPGVTYMQGHASIVIAGANETTNVAIYSVGRLTALNASLFRSDVTYDGVADLASLTILSANGRFGSVRTANASYFAAQGITGISAIGVQFSGPVYVGDISASDSAIPLLLLGAASDVRITGGDLWQANGQPVQISGVAQLRFMDGTTSGGTLLPAQADKSHLVQNGADVTSQVVVNPSP